MKGEVLEHDNYAVISTDGNDLANLYHELNFGCFNMEIEDMLIELLRPFSNNRKIYIGNTSTSVIKSYCCELKEVVYLN